ncbi:MAG: CBS domain-containing protein, partial [Chthoniobacterales bacterium]
ELLIAVAGPAVNLVIVGILFLGLSVIHAANLSILGSEGRSFAEQLMQINIFLILFNMIPSFPMDGGRVLRALLATRLSYVKATRIAARIGQGIAVLFAVYGYFYNPILIFIAMFVFMAARQELAYCEMREKISKTSVGDIMLQRFRCLPEKATVADCASLVTQDAQPAYPIVDEALGVKGIASRESLLQVLEHQRGDMPIREVMEIGVPVLKPETSLYDAVQILQQSGHSTLPVINPAGQIVGLLLFSQLIDPSKQSKNTGAA